MRLGVAAFCLLGLVAATAAAEQPAGVYTISVNGESGLVFPTGEGEMCDTAPQGEVCVSTNVATDSSGVVTGSGILTLTGDVSGEVDLDLIGRVSGTTAKPKAAVQFTAEGTATDGTSTLDLLGAGKIKCALAVGAPGFLACKGKAKLCAFLAGQKIDCAKLPVATQLAYGRQPFDIHLDLATGVKGVVIGDGNVEIGVVQIASYTVKGKYKASADVATLALKSVDPGAKTKIALKKVALEAGSASAGTAVFKIAGQKGRAELPSIAPTFVPCPAPFQASLCSVQEAAALTLFLEGIGYPDAPTVPSSDPYPPPP